MDVSSSAASTRSLTAGNYTPTAHSYTAAGTASLTEWTSGHAAIGVCLRTSMRLASVAADAAVRCTDAIGGP